MAILLVAMMLGLQAVPAPPPNDIVVIGERMRRVKLVTKKDSKTGLTRCVFKRRSGDPAFDTLMCDALLTCSKTVTTRLQMEACMGPHVEAYARELAERRGSPDHPR